MLLGEQHKGAMRKNLLGNASVEPCCVYIFRFRILKVNLILYSYVNVVSYLFKSIYSIHINMSDIFYMINLTTSIKIAVTSGV